jgi:hypothetical protein
MVHYKSIFVAFAAISTVVAGPCKPSTTTTTAISEATSTQTSVAEETSIITADDTTTAAPTTTTIEAALTTTTTEAEATTSAAAPPSVCRITGYFLPNQALTYVHDAGKKDSAKQCLEACAASDGCEVVAFYTETYATYDIGTCEFFSGTLVTDHQETSYEWYDVGCLAGM